MAGVSTRARAAVALAAATLLFAPGARSAPSATCEPLRVARPTASLPPAWRSALEALIEATREPGQPWSCPGGSVELTLDGEGALLSLVDARGRKVIRRVPAPDELLATGQALLATVPAPTAKSPVVVDTPPPAASAREPAPVRFRVEALLGTRVSGAQATGWGSGQLRAIFPIGAWSLGSWARYDLPFAGPSAAPLGFSQDAVNVGFLAGRRLVDGPVEVHVSLDPALAVVRMEAGREDAAHPEGDRVTFRVGTTLAGTFPIAGMFRGVISLDAEFAPAGFTGVRVIQASLPPVPIYSAGLSLGVEAVIR